MQQLPALQDAELSFEAGVTRNSPQEEQSLRQSTF